MQFLNKEKWDQLTGDLQALWKKHIDFGDRIWLAEMERTELINQIHEKKCERYRLRNKDGDLMYYNMLFLGRSYHRHLDPFPCHFQGVNVFAQRKLPLRFCSSIIRFSVVVFQHPVIYI